MCLELCFPTKFGKVCVCIPQLVRWPLLPPEGPVWIEGDGFDPRVATELSALATISAAAEHLAGDQQHAIRTALAHVTEAMQRQLPGVTFESRPG
jgi:hypothetical protein